MVVVVVVVLVGGWGVVVNCGKLVKLNSNVLQ